jgi:hypothetical protein
MCDFTPALPNPKLETRKSLAEDDAAQSLPSNFCFLTSGCSAGCGFEGEPSAMGDGNQINAGAATVLQVVQFI